MAKLCSLPAEIILCIMDSLLLREVMDLGQVSSWMRALSLWHLEHVYGMKISSKICTTQNRPLILEAKQGCDSAKVNGSGQSSPSNNTFTIVCEEGPGYEKDLPQKNERLLFSDKEETYSGLFNGTCDGATDTDDSQYGTSDDDDDQQSNTESDEDSPMSEFELYLRLTLHDFYLEERTCPSADEARRAVVLALEYCKKLLRRLYFIDPINQTFQHPTDGDTDYEESSLPSLHSLYSHTGKWNDTTKCSNNHHHHSNDNDDNDNNRNVLQSGFRELNSITAVTFSALQDSNGAPGSGVEPALNPYVSSTENLHILARVIADQVCRGFCLPETAVLILQCLCSLHDQDHFQYLVNAPDKNLTLRVPISSGRVSVGQLCFQYLVPVVLNLLRPSPPIVTPQRQPSSTMASLPSPAVALDESQPQFFTFKPSPKCRNRSLYGRTSKSGSKGSKNIPLSGLPDRPMALTEGVFPSQQRLLRLGRMQSIPHLTRILCFLPLLGRHFNTLPTSTFIETFLDRSKGDLPIDRAAVMVYGYMCVLDLETGKANLASDSYKIFERSMPTHGAVQAKEMVRMVERHRQLIQGFLLSSPMFSSSRSSRQ
ncbi:hypothetical protein BGW38_005251 [Lunasporangiospora selenospora]|uniref:F-box domain-containing protein n=1 Tax=Lunasporangiospora selenospora TaxID=979761 RepID=A0A9P6KB03_9FUNG|nr:hypothetical protein BGW38_005251 [Lunasporangiospora selenospora]